MKNYVQPGDTIAVTAAADVQSGQGVLVGTLFGVAQNAALTGAELLLVTRGVFDLPKVGSQAWTVGASVYWDNANTRCTTSASGNTLIGNAVAAVGSGAGEATGRVRLSV